MGKADFGRVKIITDEECISYRQPGHPERPERISRTLEELQKDQRWLDLKIPNARSEQETYRLASQATPDTLSNSPK